MFLFSEIGGDRVTVTQGWIYIIRRDSKLDVIFIENKVGLEFTYTIHLMNKFRLGLRKLKYFCLELHTFVSLFELFLERTVFIIHYLERTTGEEPEEY
jgi:hypothetical protein